MRLRSAELLLPDTAKAAAFLEETWGTPCAGASKHTTFFRGTGDHPYIFCLTETPQKAAGVITFAGSAAEVDAARERAKQSGLPVSESADYDVPGGGAGFDIVAPEGHRYRLIVEGEPVAKLPDADKPIQITHVVLNCRDVPALERFSTGVLGFKVSDRTKMMTFVRCNRKHHALAYAHADASTLNHVAFEMRGLDAVMRGYARMREAGFETVWGPGRHGPGNNIFNYFIAPFGAVIEYTAEISEVDEHYKVGGPEDWKWPPGRIDHWGISTKDVARTSAAERQWPFR